MQKKIIRFDIETVAETSSYGNYQKKKYRAEKCRDNKFPGLNEEESFYKNAGIYPEFSKVICISTMVDGEIKSFSSKHREDKIIKDFFEYLDKFPDYVLGGFNILKFDIPFLRKRSIIYEIKPHNKLCVLDTKPRDRKEVDVMNLWKQGSFSCSLGLLTKALYNISPKDLDVNSRNIFEKFYKTEIAQDTNFGDFMKKFEEYCEGDVKATKKIYEKIQSILDGGQDPEKKEETEKKSEKVIENKATEKQIKFLKVLRRNVCISLKIEKEDREKKLKEYISKKNGLILEELSVAQASDLISWFNDCSEGSLKFDEVKELLGMAEEVNLETSKNDDDLPF